MKLRCFRCTDNLPELGQSYDPYSKNDVSY
jgi:hypothetical protein